MSFLLFFFLPPKSLSLDSIYRVVELTQIPHFFFSFPRGYPILTLF